MCFDYYYHYEPTICRECGLVECPFYENVCESCDFFITEYGSYDDWYACMLADKYGEDDDDDIEMTQDEEDEEDIAMIRFLAQCD